MGKSGVDPVERLSRSRRTKALLGKKGGTKNADKRKADVTLKGGVCAQKKRKVDLAKRKADVEQEQQEILDSTRVDEEEDDTPVDLNIVVDKQRQEIAELRVIVEGLLTRAQAIEVKIASFDRKVDRVMSERNPEQAQVEVDALGMNGICVVAVSEEQALEKRDRIFMRNFNTEGSNLAVRNQSSVQIQRTKTNFLTFIAE